MDYTFLGEVTLSTRVESAPATESSEATYRVEDSTKEVWQCEGCLSTLLLDPFRELLDVHGYPWPKQQHDDWHYAVITR